MECLACNYQGEFLSSLYPSAGRTNVLHFEVINVCPKCGMGSVQTSLTQDDLDQFYSSGGYWSDAFSSAGLLTHQMVQAKVRLEKVEPYLNSRRSIRVLDIGAGNAFIADHLRKFFPTQKLAYYFIEPDKNLAESNLRKKLDFEIQSMRNASEFGEKFDVVFLNHVIEHVFDPIGLLKTISKSLGPSGIIYVELPNRDDQFKTDVFPHTLFFTKDAFERMSAKAEVNVLSIEIFGSEGRPGRFNFRNRFWGRIFHHSVKHGCSCLSEFSNRRIYSYKKNPNGIWLRAVIQNPRSLS